MAMNAIFCYIYKLASISIPKQMGGLKIIIVQNSMTNGEKYTMISMKKY